MFQLQTLNIRSQEKDLSFPIEHIRCRNPLVLGTRTKLFLYPYTQAKNLGATGTRVCTISRRTTDRNRPNSARLLMNDLAIT